MKHNFQILSVLYMGDVDYIIFDRNELQEEINIASRHVKFINLVRKWLSSLWPSFIFDMFITTKIPHFHVNYFI